MNDPSPNAFAKWSLPALGCVLCLLGSSDTAGRRTTLSLPNDVVVTYNYDGASQLTEVVYEADSLALGNLTYGYDATRSVVAVGGNWARTGLPSALAAATYDAANQLASWGRTEVEPRARAALMATSDGIATEDWDAIQQFALDIANAADEVVARARTRALLDSVDQLMKKYGLRPSLMGTRADYIEDEQERELLYLSAYEISKSDADIENCLLLAHSLAEFYSLRNARRSDAQHWLSVLERHLVEKSDKYLQQEYRRLSDILGK